MATIYTTKATALAGRNGKVSTDDGTQKKWAVTVQRQTQSNYLQQATQHVSQTRFFMLLAKRWFRSNC